MPTTVPNEPNHPLRHFHACVHCWSAFRREEFEGRAITSGILLCTKCGAQGPLNIEIRKTDKSASETEAFATKWIALRVAASFELSAQHCSVSAQWP
jgi:hypothetical protein